MAETFYSQIAANKRNSFLLTLVIVVLFALLGFSIGYAIGGEVIVPTLDGSDAKVKVPEGTQSGKQFRLKAKGMPVLRSRNLGDLYIQVVVETPQNLTRRQRELLQELYKPEVLDDLLKESEFVVNRRKEVVSMIQALNKAEEYVPLRLALSLSLAFVCRMLTTAFSFCQDRGERVSLPPPSPSCAAGG